MRPPNSRHAPLTRRSERSYEASADTGNVRKKLQEGAPHAPSWAGRGAGAALARPPVGTEAAGRYSPTP